jgi:hypothetical protein
LDQLELKKSTALARIISAAENFPDVAAKNFGGYQKNKSTIPVLGITELVAQENHLLWMNWYVVFYDFPEKPSD